MQLEIINLKQFFDYEFLFQPTSEPMRYALYFFILFGLALIASVLLYFLANKKTIKFQKSLYRRSADFLFYLPILMILYLFIRRAGLQVASQRIILVGLMIIWLIWLLFLLYYRLVIVSRLYRQRDIKISKEKYLRNGKRKN